MKPALIAVGSLGLVLGASLISIAPLYLQTGLYEQELQSLSSPSGNATKAFHNFTGLANQAIAMAFLGAAIAAVGGFVLAYGLAARRAEQAQGVPSSMGA